MGLKEIKKILEIEEIEFPKEKDSKKEDLNESNKKG